MSTKMSRREFIKTAAITAGGAILAACAPQVIEKTVEVTKEVTVKETVVVPGATQIVEKVITPGPEQAVKLSFWHGDWSVWNPHFDGLAARAYYSGLRPKIELDAPPMPWNEFWDKVTVSGEAGVGPDILYLNYNSYKRLFKAKSLRPIPETVYPYSDLEKDFWKPGLDALKIVDGQYYYCPWELHPPGGIQYNKSLLEREGFKEPPKSWDEFLNIAQKCVKEENGQVVQDGMGMDGPYMFLTTLLYPSMGGTGPYPQDETPDALKSDVFAEAFETYADFVRKYKIMHPDFLTAVGGWWGGAFLYGKVAFEWWYSGANITLEQQTKDKGSAFNTEYAIPKVGSTGLHFGTRPNWGPGITTACPAEKLDAAWNFWKYTLSTDELLNYSQLTVLPSSRTSVQAMGREAYPAGPRGDEALVELNNIVKYGYIFGQPINETIYIQAYVDTWEDILGGKSAKQAISDRWGEYWEGYTGNKL